MKYVIITPAKNEEEYIGYLLESVTSQSLLPKEWIIVDDNSSDDTSEVVKRYSNRYDWIKLVKNAGAGESRKGGAKVVRAFNKGYHQLSEKDFDFVVKLDADLTLPQDYFERIAHVFSENSKAGIVGGYCVIDQDGDEKVEKTASYHIRGAFKSIRRECWEDIGGFREVLGWDGLDEMEAMYNGWETKSLDLPIKHHRPTFSASKDKIKLAKRYGEAHYCNGSNLFLTLIRAVVRIQRKPYLLYSFFYLQAYFLCLIKGEEKNINKDLAGFINRFHLKRLFSLKRY